MIPMPIPDLNLNLATSSKSGDIKGGDFLGHGITFAPKSNLNTILIVTGLFGLFLYVRGK
jgi:hypothetical protein